MGEVLRIWKRIVPILRKTLRGICIVRICAGRMARLPIVYRTKRRIRHHRPKHVNGCAMAQIDVMDGLVQGRFFGNPRRVRAETISEQGEDTGFVEGCKSPDAIAIAPRDECRIVGKPSRDVAVLPTAEFVERLRQVPVVEAYPGFDAGLEKRIDQSVIEF